MAKRDARSRLIDNIGRQIRRLNEREKSGQLNNMQLRGLNRQRENLKAYREEVKKINKNDAVALAKAQSDYKNNGNFSSSQKEIDQNTKRLVASGILPPEELDPRPPERQQPDDYTEPVGSGGGGSGGAAASGGMILGPDEPDDSDSGGVTVMDQFGDLFSDLAQIDGMYIGAYASAEVKDQMQKILDKINGLKGGDLGEMTEEQMAQLDQLAERLETAGSNRHGNMAIRDATGKVYGYSNTFNRHEFSGVLQNLGGVNFDVNAWIRENINLFNPVQSHPGTMSSDERFERDNAGILGNWDY